MNNIFGKSFIVVDELYFNIEKEKNIGERRILDDYQVLKYLQELHEIVHIRKAVRYLQPMVHH